ncbi:MAG: class I SAM-dependent methyltransferase [Candidatus Riflebacteria bacterium]|nr:class I SAM-dependent methyltransferase [Candidatus Riflebacteria bacterium]
MASSEYPVALPGDSFTPQTNSHPPLSNAIVRQKGRNRFIKLEKLIDALDIASGMAILDVGAGPGYASILFAEKLHGTGEVYSTDIREDFVDHIADEAKKRGLPNLFSALVKKEGLDDFYGKHRYDIVLLSNVYHCLDNRTEYFTKLRDYLKPNARLVIVMNNQVPLFSENDLADVKGLAVALSSGSMDNPFFEELSTATKQLIVSGERGAGFRKAIVNDFNSMLKNPQFYKHFYSGSFIAKINFSDAERDFANWLLLMLQDEGVFEKRVEQIDDRAMRMVIKLNRLYFIAQFGDYLAQKGRGAYIPYGDDNRQTSKYLMFRELDAAGYKLAKEIKLSEYFEATVMVPKKP